jgi:hypothetical protein
MPESLRYANIELANIADAMATAKRNAAEFLYQHALTLMDRNDRHSARQAYDKFIEVKQYFNVYKDVDAQIGRAKELGTNKVLFQITNASPSLIHEDFHREITTTNVASLNAVWLQYHTTELEGLHYDYSIVTRLEFIEVSPERMNEKQKLHEKEIEDGWQYVLDENGNVAEDSLGNDVKEPKYVTVRCKTIEITQEKIATLGGKIEYYNNETNQLLKSIPIQADGVFKNVAIKVEGDRRALTKVFIKRLNNKVVPFPADYELLIGASQSLKDIMTRALRDNEYLVRN